MSTGLQCIELCQLSPLKQYYNNKRKKFLSSFKKPSTIMGPGQINCMKNMFASSCKNCTLFLQHCFVNIINDSDI